MNGQRAPKRIASERQSNQRAPVYPVDARAASGAPECPVCAKAVSGRQSIQWAPEQPAGASPPPVDIATKDASLSYTPPLFPIAESEVRYYRRNLSMWWRWLARPRRYRPTVRRLLLILFRLVIIFGRECGAHCVRSMHNRSLLHSLPSEERGG